MRQLRNVGGGIEFKDVSGSGSELGLEPEDMLYRLKDIDEVAPNEIYNHDTSLRQDLGRWFEKPACRFKDGRP